MNKAPKRKRPPGPSSRDLGLDSNQAGKGDTARSCFSEDYKENFSEIAGFGSAAGFTQKKNGRQVKTYSRNAETPNSPSDSTPHLPKPRREVDWSRRDCRDR